MPTSLTKMIVLTVTMKEQQLDPVQRSLAWLHPVNSLLAIPVTAIRLIDVPTIHLLYIAMAYCISLLLYTLT
jgi:hypothetical protein